VWLKPGPFELPTAFAATLAHAPDAAGPAPELAATANAIPKPVLAALTAKLAALDPRAVSSTLAVRAREVAIDLEPSHTVSLGFGQVP
jgi:hypothetical protein